MSGSGFSVEELRALANGHGLEPLLAGQGRFGDRREELSQLAVSHLVRQEGLRRVLDRLHEERIDVLVFKGAALEHLIYDTPYLRPRTDADLLVRRRDVESTERILLSFDYVRQVEPDTEIASSQRHYAPRRPLWDPIDLHWRIVNPLAFGDVIAFDAALDRSIAVPALGSHARSLSLADALLVACIHRVAHHADAIELRWLYEIHLLVHRLDAAGRERFAALAASAGARAVCVRSLELAQDLFGTDASAMIGSLREGVTREASAGFVAGNRTVAAVVASDLAHASGWRARWRVVREHLFPGFGYMRARYPGWPPPLLPLAYAYRALAGAPAWFRRPQDRP